MKVIRSIDTVARLADRLLAAVAGIALIVMMFFTVADMVLRGIGRPLAGSYEVIGWLSATAVALALGYTQRHQGHVAIDLVVTALPPRARAIVDLLIIVASLLLFMATGWYIAGYGIVLHETGSLSETLKAIVYPWVYLVALGCTGLALALLADLLRAVPRAFGPGRIEEQVTVPAERSVRTPAMHDGRRDR